MAVLLPRRRGKLVEVLPDILALAVPVALSLARVGPGLVAAAAAAHLKGAVAVLAVVLVFLVKAQMARHLVQQRRHEMAAAGLAALMELLLAVQTPVALAGHTAAAVAVGFILLPVWLAALEALAQCALFGPALQEHFHQLTWGFPDGTLYSNS